MTHHLNPHQDQAVKHIEGPMLVIAGAGSGKTRIITHRIVHLLNIGVPAAEILAVTFTNKAAEEMKHRINQLSFKNILTCTFHSLAAKILRESIHLIGFSNQFSIYDEDDSLSLIKSCLKTLGYEDEKSRVKSIKSSISQAKNDLKQPNDLKEDSTLSSLDFTIFKSTYSLYQQKLKEYNALDFDDLLFQCVHLLKTSEPARVFYQNKWSFILIDEYQDTNEAQYLLTKLLVQKHQNLFVVGDPDQSIYSWRGANIQNILNFEKDFKNAKVIKLEQNYRSTNHILSAANSLIQKNPSRYEKNLWSALGDGEKVQITIHENEYEESRYVMQRISSHYARGIGYEKMVIFYRTNAQSRIYEDALLKQKIPYLIVGGISFYQRKEIKDLLSYLKVAISPSDFISFSRTINLPKRGLGPSFIEKLKEVSERASIPILEVCSKLICSPLSFIECKPTTKQQESLKSYLEVIDYIQHGAKNRILLKELIRNTIEKSNYLEHLKEDKESYEDRKANLDELITKASEWDEENEELTLEHFLEELSLKSSSEGKNPYHESVKLMTLHNGKGLEFDVTCIVGLEEEILPHVNSKHSNEELEEERRLLYVGMTRAKKHLYLTSSSYRMLWGTPRLMEPSRFLQELDQEHLIYPLKKERFFERREERSPPTLSRQSFSEEKSAEDEFRVGSYVIHKDFGKGIIQKAYMTSLGKTYDVFFNDTRSTKSLVAKFAKLKRG